MKLLKLLLATLLVLLLRKLFWCLRWLWCYYHGRELPENISFLPRQSGRVFLGHLRPAPEAPVELSTEPDAPAAFGYNMSWLAVRCGDPERVLAALGPANCRCANWQTGIQAAYARQGCFVSPCLDGFVLVVGVLSSPAYDPRKLAAQFPELQGFLSHRDIHHYAWEKYVNGHCVRKYYYANVEAESDSGPLTPEELSLGFDRFPRQGQAAGSGSLPTEEDVLDIAAAWGVDPRFTGRTDPPSTGWLCDGCGSQAIRSP